ncbi:MAG: homoserine kinase [Blastochloris sp.]|nr:homoserine kinase [Blastochloris sp.]
MNSVTVQVPATTANLGPGFDVLGLALQLYNRITLRPGAESWPDAFMEEAASHFYLKTGLPPQAFHVSISGSVPRSRGLGSSVTVRLGLLSGLNHLHQNPLSPEDILRLVITLEGHPDNAVPAALGGFAACAADRWFRTEVDPRLLFVACVPKFEVETKKARSVLPAQIPLADAILNLQNSSQLVAAFATRNYSLLKGSFGDRLHQPYRAQLIPACLEAFALAEKNGALGSFISGSGSTLMAICQDNPEPLVSAWTDFFGPELEIIHVLAPDNQGVRILD